MKETLLAGGSLATTSLIENFDKIFVRKKISLVKNREYGYYRWYSQLKKMQRLGEQFPKLFPVVIDYGCLEKTAYMDLEYRSDAVNCYQYLSEENRTKEEAELLVDKIRKASSQIHQIKASRIFASNAMGLYFQEEVLDKLRAADLNASAPLEQVRNKAIDIWNSLLLKESMTHGNLTLENILYLQDSNEVMFIDVYEENIIDIKHTDYSQLLQSSTSHYEIMVSQGENYTVPDGINWFNTKLLETMRQEFSKQELMLIKFFECSQFYRMLPFKVATGSDPAPFLTKADILAEEFLNERN